METHRLHRGARKAWARISFVLGAVGLVLIVGALYRPGVTDRETLLLAAGVAFCAVGVWTLYRTSRRGIELHSDELVMRNIFGTKRVRYDAITALALYRMPIRGGGIVGGSTRMMAGGDTAVGVFIKTKRGKTHGMVASMHESWPELVTTLEARTGIKPVELNDSDRLDWLRSKPP